MPCDNMVCVHASEEVLYLTASECGWALDSIGKGHWTSSGGCGGDKCLIETEMGIMPHLDLKGWSDHGHPFPLSWWKAVRGRRVVVAVVVVVVVLVVVVCDCEPSGSQSSCRDFKHSKRAYMEVLA